MNKRFFFRSKRWLSMYNRFLEINNGSSKRLLIKYQENRSYPDSGLFRYQEIICKVNYSFTQKNQYCILSVQYCMEQMQNNTYSL